MLRVLDLFAGIGGFSLGLERTGGFETVAFCEIEKYPQKVLAKHWPDVPIYDDVRELDGEQFRGTVDVVCGGYPCQPFSLAGKRGGETDDRHLWPEFARIIRQVRPQWVIGENVVGHITLGLDDVLSDLEGLGYAWESFVIPACAVNALHRRDRVWIVANRCEQGLSVGKRKPGVCGEEKQGVQGQTSSVGINPPFPSYTSRWKQQERREYERMGWEKQSIPRIERPAAEPTVRRGIHGIPSRVDRIKALGNAVVPQIPELIGRAILAEEATRKGIDIIAGMAIGRGEDG